MENNKAYRGEQTGQDLENASGITRKEAIKKMGRYAAVTALGAYIVLNPKKAQAQSAETSNPTGPGGGQWTN